MAGPRQEGLPRADILTREDPRWQKRRGQYRLVIQNYRMINDERRILWSPGGPLYAISAVAEDGDGRSLFLHCREPLEAYSFAHALLHLPLDVRTVMYVEGGMQAGLVIRSPGCTRSCAAATWPISGSRAMCGPSCPTCWASGAAMTRRCRTAPSCPGRRPLPPPRGADARNRAAMLAFYL